MSSASTDSFTSCFQTWILFIYFTCLIAVARISNIILNKRDGSGYSHFIPNLKGIAFTFSPLRMMLAVGLSFMDFLY